MKYRFTVPPTCEVGSYAGNCTGPDYRKDALWDYNSCRAHDGLPPLERMPAGTVYTAIPEPRKWRTEYVIQGNYGYGHGWEDENTEETRKDGLRSLREYRENGPGAYRLITRRVRNEETATA